MIDAAGRESMRRAAAFEERRRSIARREYVIASLLRNHSQRDGDFAEWERQLHSN
jgi:hypothetical protein